MTTCCIGVTKNFNFILLVLELVIVEFYITLLWILQQGCEGLVMVSMMRFVAYNHYIISNYSDLFNLAKTFIKLVLENITNYCSSKGHHCIAESANLSIECGQKGWSFIKLLMPITFSAITHCNDTCIYKHMCNIFWCFEMIWFALQLYLDWWSPSRFLTWVYQACPSPPLPQRCLSKAFLDVRASGYQLITFYQYIVWVALWDVLALVSREFAWG